MDLHSFISKYSGETVLYNKQDESLRGQCVQLVCFYVEQVLKSPVVWADAHEWWDSPNYQRVGVSELQPGDLVVWQSTLPGTYGSGHIGIFYYKVPGGFVSFDSNWGGKFAHLVTHDFSYVLGGLRPLKTQGATNVIPDQDNYYQRYGVDLGLKLRGRVLSRDEFRRFLVGQTDLKAIEILSDSDEANYTQGLQNLGGQAVRDQWRERILASYESEKKYQELINQQNQVITELNVKLKDAEVSGKEKQQALNEALGKLAEITSAFEQNHDKVAEVGTAPSEPEKTSLLVKILASLFARKP